MAKISAKNAYLLIGGYQMSPLASQYGIDYSVNPIEVTGFTDGWRNYIPGIYSGQLSIDMYWDGADNVKWAVLKNHTKECVTLIPAGSTEGNVGFMMWAEQENYTPQGQPSSAITLGSITFKASSADGGPLPCILLQDATITNTASSTAYADPTVGDITARCAGVLHIYQACAADRYQVVIESSSAEGGVYTALLTFTLDGSVIGSEMVQAASGAFKEFIRVTATRTGTAGNNFGFACAFWHSNM